MNTHSHPQSLIVRGTSFSKVCEVAVEQNSSALPELIYPQERHDNSKGLKLNGYGHGPFCRFKIPRRFKFPGVYIIAVEGLPKCVGQCKNLEARFNMGYGNISPRNCYVGGQETNCRINNLILQEAESGKRVSLFFRESADHKNLERIVLKNGRLPWNRA